MNELKRCMRPRGIINNSKEKSWIGGSSGLVYFKDTILRFFENIVPYKGPVVSVSSTNSVQNFILSFCEDKNVWISYTGGFFYSKIQAV